MFLTRLLYVSDYSHNHDFNAEQMLAAAIQRNKENQITGALWFTGSQFIQVLEGGRHAVSETYHRIAGDTRHHNIELVSCNAVHERLFPEWSMGYFGDTPTNQSTVLKFSTTNDLKPAEMSPDSLIGVLLTLQLRKMGL